VIAALRRVFGAGSAAKRDAAQAERPSEAQQSYPSADSAQRIEAARRRLKASIPPPED
jgi:hypothetical protein